MWNNSVDISFSPVQGVLARYIMGNASAENSEVYGQITTGLARVGLAIAKR